MIRPQTAQHVLHFFGRAGGADPGSFKSHLIAAIASADIAEFDRLAGVYPDIAAAVHVAKYDADGITKLQMVAVGREAA